METLCGAKNASLFSGCVQWSFSISILRAPSNDDDRRQENDAIQKSSDFPQQSCVLEQDLSLLRIPCLVGLTTFDGGNTSHRRLDGILPAVL
jgi:hypothetical protein